MKLVSIKFSDHYRYGEVELKENQYFACCIFGAKWTIPTEQIKYMTQEGIWLRILEKTSDNEVYVCKEPCRGFREPYLAIAIVELERGDKYFELSNF